MIGGDHPLSPHPPGVVLDAVARLSVSGGNSKEDAVTILASQGEVGVRTAQRLRAAVLGPRGGGTTRRRASDAFRIALAVLVVAVSVPVMRDNTAAELGLVRVLNPPPAAISWLVTAAFWLGSAGVIVGLVLLSLLTPRLTVVRRVAVAALGTWAVCALLGVVLGPDACRPVTSALSGVDVSYPVTQLAVTVAVAGMALPYLSRPLHRLMVLLIAMALTAAVAGGFALPVNALSSIALGWGVVAALHLALGSPLGLPSAQQVADGIAELNVAVKDVTRAPHQVWGVEKFIGRDDAGRMLELSVYGRDAASARLLAKLWRFCFYRDSGPTLILDRIQQVEHEAYLTFMAGRAGVLVPDVLAAGRFGPSRDAAIVSRLPRGPALRDAEPAALSDDTLADVLLAVLRLRSAGIAHGALGLTTIVLTTDGPGVRDFRHASASAPAGRLDDDIAAVLTALAIRFGVERTAAVAARTLDAAAVRGAIMHLQRPALDPSAASSLREHKGLLPELRAAVALAAGIDAPKLAETKRISWINLAFGIGSLIGIWAIVGVLADVVGSLDVIKGAAWGWVALAFVFGQLPIASNAMALAGAVTGQLPFGRCLGLETSNEFTQFVGGDVAAFAVRVRFFQREGYSPATALSSGAIASTASWVAKGVLLLISLAFTAGSFAAPESSGGRHTAIWIVIGVVLAAGVAVALISVIPRLRRLASARIRPQLAQIWADVKAIAVEPRKIAYVVTGSVLSQLFVALALGAALHAVGQQASLATLLVVITGAAIIGGAVPVPGGAGVIEAGLIAGLTTAGIPQDQAVAAVFIQRLCTAYLPPVWGWVALTWMRRHEYL